MGCFAVRRGEIRDRSDVHYHKPEFRLIIDALITRYSKIKRLDEYSKVFCGPFGTVITKEDYQETGIPLLRITNITKQGTIDEKDLIFISEQKAKTLDSTHVEPGDLVVSQRGTLGVPAVVPSSYPSWNISANLIAIKRPQELLPRFLQAYLSCRFGAAQLERAQSGQVQGKITTEDVASILVPIIQDQQKLVNDLDNTRNARNIKLAQADELLKGIDELVLAELGLVKNKPEDRLSYAVRLKVMDKRLNPEYYHPDRIYAIRAITKAKNVTKSPRLVEIVDFIRDPVKVTEKDCYLGLASLEQNTGELTGQDETATGLAFQYVKDDVLFSRLRPYLNKVKRAEASGICSTEFHVMRIKRALPFTVLPEYLACILRSSPILAQTRRMMTGNTHPRLANEDVINLVVPIPNKAVQERIVEDVANRKEKVRKVRSEADSLWGKALEEFENKLMK